MYQQREFFEAHKDYSYYQLCYRIDNDLGKDQGASTDDTTAMNHEFYQRFQEHSLQYVDLSESLMGIYPVLLSNRPAMKEIENSWPSIVAVLPNATEEKAYLFLPSNLSRSSDEYQKGLEIGNVFFGKAGYGDIETITYNEDISLIGIHKFNDYRMILYENPILLYDNINYQKNELLEEHDMYYAKDTMYNISSEEWQAFVQEFQLEDQIMAKSNVLDVYEYEWSKVSRNMKLTLILSAFLLFLEMSLIIFIIRLEYQFNAIEMALKKIHGYSLFNRNRRLLTVTIVSSLIGTLAALIISYATEMQGGYPLILVGLILLVLEIGYIILRAKTIESSSVVSVLKGERI